MKKKLCQYFCFQIYIRNIGDRIFGHHFILHSRTPQSKDRVDLKNAGLIGVLSDFEEDLNIFNSMSKSLDKRTKNIESILNDDLISNKVFNELMRYFGFVGNDTNYKSMISTGSIEYIENKRLFEQLNRYYSWNYSVLKDQAKQDEMMFWKFSNLVEENHLIDSITSLNKDSLYKNFI